MKNPAWVHIIGAGVSGLMLALHLSKYKQLPGPVLISEAKPSINRSQTFGFWIDQIHPLDHLVSMRWHSWTFSSCDENKIHHFSKKFEYALVEGNDFFDWAYDQLQLHPDITLQLNSPIHNKPAADFVFDSRPPQQSKFDAFQCFVGYEIENEDGIFIPKLMESMHVMNDSLVFLYELPLSSGRKLIEWTSFGSQPFDLEILSSLGIKQVGSQAILRTECGIIPMGLNNTLASNSFGIPIGARGGMTRDASGYGFLKMWDKTSHIAESLFEQNQFVYENIEPNWQRWMDSRLIKLIHEKPDQLPEIFMSLASRLSGDSFARFMMDPNWLSAIKIILASPKRPFLLSAFRK